MMIVTDARSIQPGTSEGENVPLRVSLPCGACVLAPFVAATTHVAGRMRVYVDREESVVEKCAKGECTWEECPITLEADTGG